MNRNTVTTLTNNKRTATITIDTGAAHPCTPGLGFAVDSPAVRGNNTQPESFATSMRAAGWAMCLAEAIVDDHGAVTGWTRTPVDTITSQLGQRLGAHLVLIGYDPKRMDHEDLDTLMGELVDYANGDCWKVAYHNGFEEYAYGWDAALALARAHVEATATEPATN